jgi:hypothetical protein
VQAQSLARSANEVYKLCSTNQWPLNLQSARHASLPSCSGNAAGAKWVCAKEGTRPRVCRSQGGGSRRPPLLLLRQPTAEVLPARRLECARHRQHAPGTQPGPRGALLPARKASDITPRAGWQSLGVAAALLLGSH